MSAAEMREALEQAYTEGFRDGAYDSKDLPRSWKNSDTARFAASLPDEEGMVEAQDCWRPIETAPRDGTWIIAKVRDDISGRDDHFAGRCFVVRHMGQTSSGFDMGWALFPGMGVGDDFLSDWAPLPPRAALRAINGGKP